MLHNIYYCEYHVMGNDELNSNGYESDGGDPDEYKDQILQLCKLAQGNITTIYWCKQQIRKRLKVLDRLINRMAKVKKMKLSADRKTQQKNIEGIIKKQTDACKNLGIKIQEEIDSLEQIRVAAKSFGINIKTRLLELDDTLDTGDIDPLLGDVE